MPNGSGAAKSTLVTISAVVGTRLKVFTFDPPVVTFLNSVNGPSTLGGSVTLAGSNFGGIDQTPSVRIAATSCNLYEYASIYVLRTDVLPS